MPLSRNKDVTVALEDVVSLIFENEVGLEGIMIVRLGKVKRRFPMTIKAASCRLGSEAR
jgi:hypothetical protein